MRVDDYHCQECRVTFEVFHKGEAAETVDCVQCDSLASKQFPCPKLAVPQFSFEKGKSEPRPDWCMDTRPLAEGVPYSKWIKKRRSDHRKKRVDEFAKDFGMNKSFSG